MCRPFAAVSVMLLLGAVLVLPARAQSKGGDDPFKGQAADGLKALKDANPQVRYKAVAMLSKLGKKAKFLAPTLRDMLNDPNPAVRVKVAEALWKMDPNLVGELMPVLAAALKDKDAGIRSLALTVVQQIGPRAKEVASAVCQAVKDPDFDVRLQAVQAVAALGPFAKAAVPDLLDLIEKDDTGFLEATVAVALSKVGTPALGALKKALASQDAKLRRGAAYALGLMGAKASSAVPNLVQALDDQEELVRCFAAEALGKIGREADNVVPALKKLLKDSSPSVRVSAALALWRLVKDPRSVDNLTSVLGDEKDTFGRKQAAVALAELGPAAAKAVPALQKSLHGADDSAKEDFVIALGKIGPEATPTVGELEKLLTAKSESLRVQAALALWRIRSKAGKGELNCLGKALQSEDATIRLLAARVLAEIGAPARDLVADLVPLLHDMDDSVREAARAALQSIDPTGAAKAGIK